MELKHQFTVNRPIGEVWPVLVDLVAVAKAIPGASIVDVESDGNHKGKLRVKLGSISATFNGDARYVVADADSHRFVLEGSGSSTQGSATLRVDGSAEADGAATMVQLESSVELTGRIAQFGGSMADSVADQLLDAFVVNLRQGFEGSRPETSPSPDPVGLSSSSASSSTWSGQSHDALDLGAALPSMTRYAVPGLIGLAGFLVGLCVGRGLRGSAPRVVAVMLPPRSAEL